MDSLKNVIDYGVIGLLLALSIWAVAVAVERWLFYRRVDPAQFHDLHLFEIALTKRLVIIGTIAANAPYIGLLGTVLGIMLDLPDDGHFRHDGGQHDHDRIELALKATAAGLLVAIPCVVMNNVLRRRANELVTIFKSCHGT